MVTKKEKKNDTENKYEIFQKAFGVYYLRESTKKMRALIVQ